MEEVEKKAFKSSLGTASIHWFRYVDDTLGKIEIKEVQLFIEHILFLFHLGFGANRVWQSNCEGTVKVTGFEPRASSTWATTAPYCI